eukprot:351039-Chlamydomonas_euryale.AAC.2
MPGVQLKLDVDAFMLMGPAESVLCGASAPPGSLLDLVATRLEASGYNISLRVAAGGGSNGCPGKLRLPHEFLVVRDPGSGRDVCIDVAFRGCFATPQATPRYAAAVAVVPDVLAADFASLVKLAQVGAAAAAAASARCCCRCFSSLSLLLLLLLLIVVGVVAVLAVVVFLVGLRTPWSPALRRSSTSRRCCAWRPRCRSTSWGWRCRHGDECTPSCPSGWRRPSSEQRVRTMGRAVRRLRRRTRVHWR